MLNEFIYLLSFSYMFQVEENTNKRIKDLVDPKTLDGTTSAVLVNAIYFKVIVFTNFYTIYIEVNRIVHLKAT